MAVVTSEKRALVISLGGDPPAPTGAYWQVMNFVRDDAGADVIAPQSGTSPATLADAAAYFDAALGAQRDQLAAQAGAQATQIQQLTAESEAQRQRADEAEAKLQTLRNQHDALLAEIEPV